MVSPKLTPFCPGQLGTPLSMTRGDTAGFKFQRLDNDGNVIEARPNKLFFTVKKSYEDEGFVFQKKLDDMTFDENFWWHFRILPEDTDRLKYGTYVYDLETIQSGVKSTISKGNLIISSESTWAINEGGNDDSE